MMIASSLFVFGSFILALEVTFIVAELQFRKFRVGEKRLVAVKYFFLANES